MSISISQLNRKALFVFLLPTFFVLHGNAENLGLIPVNDSLLLWITYQVDVLIISLLFYAYYRNFVKAALVTFFIFCIYLFFGAFHDFFKQFKLPVSRYSILLPLLLIMTVLMAIFLKKTKLTFHKLVFLLNLLLIVYLVIDLLNISWKSLHKGPDQLSVYNLNSSVQYQPCDSCRNPDIYFLLFDEYSSSVSLRETFNYDNSDLNSFLSQKGFSQQVHSNSNYNFTPFSMASIMNMSYIEGVSNNHTFTVEDYAKCLNLIRNNEVIQYLSSRNYKIINYSIFDLAGNPSLVEPSMLPVKTRLISEQTLFNRFLRDVGVNFLQGRFEIKWLTNKLLYAALHNNNRFLNDIESESSKKDTRPRFIYGHFQMPHPPFYFDSSFKPRAPSLLIGEARNSHVESYLGYIPYTNSKIKELIDAILTNTEGSAVIILMGDHGFKEGAGKVSKASYFQNLNAVYFPDKNYTLLKDSISAVNQFRVVFNTLFRQSFTMLKDSTFFLRDKE